MAVGDGVGVGLGVGVGVRLGRGVGVGVGPEIAGVGVGVTSVDGVGDRRSVGSGVNEPGSGEKKNGVGMTLAVACADGVSCVKGGRDGPCEPLATRLVGVCVCCGVDR